MTPELTRRGRGWLTSPRAALPSFFRNEMDRMSRLFDEFFSKEEGGPISMWGPPMDIIEKEDKILVKAELPGIDPKELDISLSGDTLIIKGNKKEDKEEEGENYYCCERHYGEFSRTVKLPSTVNKDKIDASYHNGILKVEMQKMPEAKTKKITIKMA